MEKSQLQNFTDLVEFIMKCSNGDGQDLEDEPRKKEKTEMFQIHILLKRNRSNTPLNVTW